MTLRRTLERDPAAHLAVIVGLAALEYRPGPLLKPKRRAPVNAQ